jgi:hypothetical protein
MTPTINSVSPTSGKVNSKITINGKDFGKAQATSSVSIGNNVATIDKWSETSIVVTIPTACPSGPASIIVTVNNVQSNAAQFSVVN